ncbi:MAG: ribokinase [Ramlibacter sp.]|nr:ribokinase [Cryobacterium sp.]
MSDFTGTALASPPGTTEPGSVVVVGSINVDQLIRIDRHPQPGETLIGSSMEFLPGGKGANQAVAAAQLGASVRMVGAVGRDSQAQVATAILTSAGVDQSAVRTVDGPTGLALVTVADDGENTIVVIPGANALMGTEAVQASAAVIAAAAVVVLQGEIPAAGIVAATRLATGRVVLNLAPVIPLDAAAIRRADPLVVNEHEAALVLAQLAPHLIIPTEDAELVARLREWGVASVVLTRGAKGAICADRDGTHNVASPTVVAVDSSGAGDAFVGALSAQLAAGVPLSQAVRLAVRVGAFAVQGRGTQTSYPTLADVLPTVNAKVPA